MTEILIVSSILLWVAVLFNLLLTVALVRRVANRPLGPAWPDENIPTLAVGESAPDFSAEAFNGETVSLDSFDQQQVALIFISSHCRPCIDKIPMLNALGPQAEQHGVELVLVNMGEKKETQTLVEQEQVELSILTVSHNNPILDDYKAKVTPFFCLISKDGKVQATGSFNAEWDKLVQTWRQNGRYSNSHHSLGA